MTATAQRPGGRSARVRREVLAATLHVLLEEGLDATTIPAIADRAGVHHTSIYRRWERYCWMWLGLATTTWMNSDKRTGVPDSTSARRSSSARSRAASSQRAPITAWSSSF